MRMGRQWTNNGLGTGTNGKRIGRMARKLKENRERLGKE